MIQVFISYAKEDFETAERLYSDFKKAGIQPWLDTEDLLPGQHWETEIYNAIKKSTFFISLLSPNSVKKKGFVQKEMKKALDIFKEFPSKTIFIIPVRISYCELPENIADIHCEDIYPSYQKGLEKILKVLKKEDKPAKSEIRETLAFEKQKQKKPKIELTGDIIHTPIFVEKPDTEIYTDKRQKLKVTLCSEPRIVSENDSEKIFKLNKYGNPKEYIENDFEDIGDTIVDHRTCLVWQKSGSEDIMDYKKAQAYIKKLNKKRLVGDNEWRLPTIEELMSLLEQEKQSNRLYINKIFDSKQTRCWSADKSAKSVWGIHFNSGRIGTFSFGNYNWVRAVRSRQP